MESFVRVWQSAKNITEVCKKTGMARSTAYRHAQLLRDRGCELKLFRYPPTGDREIDKLNNLIGNMNRGAV